ncbi:OmpA family protein [Pseudomonas chlororaphis]|uniref:OmpA family protein n=1 Tax=Pseudomonas chlororaphis TaxID=587753 RepID=UPI0003D391AE|nr:OmpA family protein [Pseudomonas chlororaphis]AZD30809.1 Outer membrane protein A precursor [Pseudomonas chlororaphis]ETD34935.1 OmpA family protein [Pseudomonas chlororaphis subsp. aurantiaca PB-St2]QFS56158.1 OmpA family protein [Pseudomonas chlororaphis subsp. aurantiaca]
MKIFKTCALTLLFSGACMVFSAQAAEVFGKGYLPVAAVGSSQAQVVFYRDDQTAGSANVYIDGEFQSALLPNGFTTFCVAPGGHSLGAFIKDAPLYQGKRDQPWRSDLKGGQTYFLKVGNGIDGKPQFMSRTDAEKALRVMKEQTHTLSRASTVQACQYLEEKPQDYTLSGDVLFRFGKADRSNITAEGHQAITDLVRRIRAEHSTIRSVQVTGHTDPIGAEGTNMLLGQRRAETVRLLMIQAGIAARDITATSAGMSEPVVTDCYGSKAEQIACYAPNRRVSVRVDGNSAVGQ